MSRRKKNAGRGFGMMFHGAFADKKAAKKKERAVHGFIQPRNIKGERRYVVMSERKNPIRRKKNQVRYLGGSEGWEARHGEVRVKAGTAKEALRQLRVQLGLEKEEKSKGRSHHRGNAMDLMVMGANPAPREVIVHPGETITLKVNPSAEAIREEFTGREYEDTFISDEPHMRAGDYAQIGDMMGISFKPKNGGQVEAIGWYEGSDRIPLHEAAKQLRTLTDAPVLVSDTTRRQLYFVSGNQDLSLLILGYIDAGHDAKDGDIWELGEARTVVYREKKWMDKFRTINYQHRFGEENGKVPKLLYDARVKRLLLEGGDYEVRPEGITN